MKSLQLFEHFERTDGSWRSDLEGSFEFLNRVAGPHWDQIRSLLESWFKRVPVHDQKEMLGLFRAPDDLHHQGAIFELVISQLLVDALGEARVQIKPERRGPPDFRIVDDRGRLIPLEAKYIAADEGLREPAHVLAVYAALDERVHSMDFTLGVSVLTRGTGGAPINKVVAAAERLLAGLSYDEALEQRGTPGALANVSVVEHAGWTVRLTATARSAELRSTPQESIVGFRTGGGGAFSDPLDLKKGIGKKCKALKELGGGVAAIGWDPVSVSSAQNGESAFHALFGHFQSAYDYSRPLHGTRLDRDTRNDGLWQRNGKPQNTSVKGLLLIDQPHLWMRGELSATLWINPFVEEALSFRPPWAGIIELASDGRFHVAPASREPRDALGMKIGDDHPWADRAAKIATINKILADAYGSGTSVARMRGEGR